MLVPIGDDDDYDDEYPRVRCENVAKSSKNCAIRAVFRRRPPQALLVVKIDSSPLCSALAGRRPRRGKRHQLTHQCSINYTRSLKRESISAQSLLSNSFRKILRASDIDLRCIFSISMGTFGHRNIGLSRKRHQLNSS